MKWFKHMSDAHLDEKLEEIIDIFGFEGYGRWWQIIEVIARQMDGTNKCFVVYSWNKWQTLLKGKKNKLRTFLEHLENVSLIKLEENENKLKIECRKLLKLRDNYTKDLEDKRGVTTTPTSKQEVEEEREVEGDNKTPHVDDPDGSAPKQTKKPPAKKYSIDDYRLSEYFYQTLLSTNANHKKPNFKSWAEDIRKMREIDNRTPATIKRLWDWAQQDSFWCSNIQCPSKLREQFDKLLAKAGRYVRPQVVTDQNTTSTREITLSDELNDRTWATQVINTGDTHANQA